MYNLLSCSVVCAPAFMYISSLIGQGRVLSNLILMHKPMRVANEQCGIVGLNSTLTTLIFARVGFCTYNLKYSYIYLNISQLLRQFLLHRPH